MTRMFRSIGFMLLVGSGFSWAGELVHFQRGAVDPILNLAVTDSVASSDWVMQFSLPVTFAEQKSLASQGLKVLGYLPDDALAVRGTGAAIAQAQAQNKNIRAVMIYPPEMKLSAQIPALSILIQDKEGLYSLKTFARGDSEKVGQKIEEKSLGQIIYQGENQLLVRAPIKNLLAIAALTGVEAVEIPAQMQTQDIDLGIKSQELNDGDYMDLTGFETGTKLMNFDSVWNQGFRGQGQMASMADTGLDSGELATVHQDFKEALVEGQIFGLFSKSWGDPMGHGTHVAGSIVGRGTASGSKLRGGAHEAQFVAQGMWSPMLSGLMVPTKLSDMFSKAYIKGARVHSNSWGAANNFGAYDSYASQVDDYVFQNQDMLIVFAAGNSGVDKDKDGRIDPGSMSSPGTAKNALTVGASENFVQNGGIQKTVSEFKQAKDVWPVDPIWSSKISDNAQGLAMFSSRGPTNDRRIKPDLVAPGTNILSVHSQYPNAELLWGPYNKDYVWCGGTSMATPLAAGAATVTRQILQQKYQIQNPSAALVKAVLMNTAFDLYPGQYGEVGAQKGQEILNNRPNSDEGFGRIDMNQLVERKLIVFDETKGLGQGESKTFRVEVQKNRKVVANLVYSDAPGSVNAAQALVNDLDLSLLKADGAVLANPVDRINNHESIELSLPEGSYQLKVTGFKVPQGRDGKQAYALVLSTY